MSYPEECILCKHFGSINPDTGVGVCRRYPPVMRPGVRWAQHPVVYMAFECGEWSTIRAHEWARRKGFLSSKYDLSIYELPGGPSA